MKKVLLSLVAILAISGCAKHELQMECKECVTHMENDKTTIDCNQCTMDYEGKAREGDILPSLPSLPERQ